MTESERGCPIHIYTYSAEFIIGIRVCFRKARLKSPEEEYSNIFPTQSLRVSSGSIKSTIERYKKAVADNSNPCPTPEINAQFSQQESKKLRQQIQMIQNTNRSLMGEGLDCLNMKELKQLENRLERGITRIRSKKHEMILAETENLQKREMELENENAFLRAKIAETERIQEQNMVPGEEYNAIQAYFARNDLVLQLNIMDAEHPPPPPPAAYQRFDKKSLHLG
ncbi:Agamous-like MADS-box protein AGL11 [Camellia lanceoleosa]|uniref:Agamous-like MADS-box protein AGL11 n=1 Tax=Camellia lanceoleosa TaxID=1840588 RepID=A0ACC0GMJ0_9ERIC|nr:Agamous-like MADS-box protein AGL11 [Camellia lanceoleosa]